MKKKIKVLAICFLGVFSANLTWANIQESESFQVSLKKRLINSYEFVGAFISNQYGEVIKVYLKESPAIRDKLFTIQKQENEEISLTVVENTNRFQLVTYHDLQNKSIIDKSMIYPTIDEITKYSILIDEISSVQSVKSYGDRAKRTLGQEFDNNRLQVSYTGKKGEGIFLEFRIDRERNSRYFYSADDEITHELVKNDLLTNGFSHILTLPNQADWKVKIIGIEKDHGKEVFLYNTFLKRIYEVAFLNPDPSLFEKYQIQLKSDDIEIYQSVEEIPESLDYQSLEIESSYVDELGGNYRTTTEEVDYFEVEYYYGGSSGNRGITIASKWTILGLSNGEVNYNLPEIPDLIRSQVTRLENLDEPFAVKLKLAEIDREILNLEWKTPNVFLQDEWRRKSGMKIWKKYILMD